jgi:hypothetical protein
MILESDLLYLKNWFDIYVKQFCTGNERIDSAICLKVTHTKNVAREILDLANTLNLTAEDCYRAEINAIFHDIGRFEQYFRYQTYSDQKSEDHAALGLKIIARTGVLSRLQSYEQDLIRNVVTYHNRASLPQSNDQELLFHLRLLRDADKIDILQVVTDHYTGFKRNESINLGLPDAPEISEKIISCILDRKIADVTDVKTINDFKLFQVSWVFDLNFPKTYQLFRLRHYLEKLSEVLPHTETVVQSLTAARSFLLQKVNV